MILIVGLGNPGDKYHFTRHNAGFLAIDSFLASLSEQRKEITQIQKASFQGELFKYKNALFLKPQTFMNCSAESVQPVYQFYHCETLIVLHDDLDLPMGALRFKNGGGNGGHNGLRSLDSALGSNYYRIRLGISRPQSQQENQIAHYVLSPFTQEELQFLQQATLKQCNAAILAILSGQTWEKTASLHSFKGQ